MKKNLFWLFAIICFSKSVSQNPNFSWVKSIGGFSSFNLAQHSITSDNCGNIYVTGGFTTTVDFDPSPTVYTLSPTGVSDIFLAKYSFNGQFQWVLQFGTASGNEFGNAVRTDASGNVYVTGAIHDGAFPSPIDFDPGPGTATFTPMGFDLFVAKYNSSGQYQWAFDVGGFATEYGTDMEIDASNNIFVIGVISTPADFDPGPGTYNVVPPGSTISTFVAKYTNTGLFQAAFAIGSSFGPVDPNGLALSQSGDVYITGNFGMSTNFGPSGGPPTPPFVANGDFYIAKYDNNLSGCYWAKGFGSNGTDYGTDIDVDVSGDLYVTGIIQGLCDVDPGPGTATFTPPPSGVGYLLAKYDTNGQYQWAFMNSGLTAKLDGTGNLVTVGSFTGTIDVDPSPSVANLVSNGGSDAYVAKYTTGGTYVSAFNFGSAPNENASNLVIKPNFGLTVFGTFSGTSDFDPSASTYTLASQTSIDMFIASYTATPLPMIPVTVSSTSSLTCAGQSVTISANGANTYSWNTGPSTSSITVSPIVNTTYVVTGTYTNACSYNTAFTQSVTTCIGIQENHNSDFIHIFPNPFSDKITISTFIPLDVPFQIYNTIGSLIYSGNVEKGKAEIDLSDQSSGIYFIKAGSSTKKIIKQ